MKAGSFVSKEEAKLLQGIAVSLMVFHHLFDFPDRIHVPYVSLLNFSFLGLEALIASFGRICVAVFAFSSGYGLRKNAGDLNQYSLLSGYKSMLCRLWTFAQRFWIVFVFFIGFGLFLGRYQWHPTTLLKNLFGLSFQYNAEWWYIAEYIRFLLLFPLLMSFLKLLQRFRCAKVIQTILFAFVMVASVLVSEEFRQPYIVCFLGGIFFASIPVFEWLDKKLSAYSVLYRILCLCVLSGVFLCRAVFLGPLFDCFYVPLFVFGFVGLLKSAFLSQIFGYLLKYPGEYSTYIWLTHTFFAYYLFQKFTFFPRYSLLIFLWCMFLSTTIGWILESGLFLLHKCLRKPKERAEL